MCSASPTTTTGQRACCDGDDEGAGAEVLRGTAQMAGSENDHAGAHRQSPDHGSRETVEQIGDRPQLRMARPDPVGPLPKSVRPGSERGLPAWAVFIRAPVVRWRYDYDEPEVQPASTSPVGCPGQREMLVSGRVDTYDQLTTSVSFHHESLPMRIRAAE